MLRRTQSVLLLATRTDGEVVFDYPVGPDEVESPTLCIRTEMWRDMGSPGTVTITIEPGDLLNDDTEDCE